MYLSTPSPTPRALRCVSICGSLALVLAISLPATAADVQGTISVERKLTKRNVTASAGLYQRGAAVEVSADAEQDPLAWERAHVVIYLDGPAERKPEKGVPSPAPAASIEQKDRRFSPDIVTVPANSVVSFPNFDPVFHNVFSLSKPKSFDLGNYAKGQTRLVTFPQPGVVLVYCHLHPNMSAAIVVTPNRYAAIADGTGKFTLHDVPPGKYTVVAWHKTAGSFRQTIEVTDKGASGVHFLIPLAADPTESTTKVSPSHEGHGTSEGSVAHR